MVRTKDKPKHVSSAQQKRVTWNISSSEVGECSTARNFVDDDVPDLIDDDDDEEEEDDDDDDDDDDYDYKPSQSFRRNTNISEDYSETIELDDKPVKQPRKRVEKSKKFDYGTFDKVLKNCDFSIKICTELLELKNKYFFGEISFPIINFNNEFQIENSFWIYISKECDKSAIYFEWLENKNNPSGKKNATNKIEKIKYFHVDGSLDTKLWSGLSSQRCFQILFNKLEDNILSLKVYFLESGFVNLNFPAEYSICKKSISSVLSYFYSIEPFEKDGKKNFNHNFDEFYRSIKNLHQGVNYSSVNVQHFNLIPQLRPYQKQAVQWMLHQERVFADKEDNPKLHPLYMEITSLDNKTLYYNRFGCFFVKEKPLEVPACPGGILADEMGLGKTVEVLACIMCHTRPEVDIKVSSNKPLCENGLNKHENFTNNRNKDLESNTDLNSNANLNEDIKTEDVESSSNSNLDENNKIDNVESSSSDLEGDIINSNSNKEIGSVNCDKENFEFDNDEDIISESNHDKYSMDRTKRRPKRKASRIINYSLLDSVLDSDDNDKTYKNDKDYVYENETFENEDDEYVGKQKSKFVDDDYENEYFEFEPVAKKRKLNSLKFDAEKAISASPILSTIDRVILDISWNGILEDYIKEGSHKEYRNFLKLRRVDPYYMMSMREKLNMDYMNSLSKYSSIGALKRASIEGYFDTKIEQKSYFECVCGKGRNSNSVSYMSKVQCSLCSLWQHADCVQFKIDNSNKKEYICPHCWTTQSLLKSGATLIVAPSSISYQWVNEIRKHIKEKSIKVFVYEGVSHHGYIQPQTLACNDLVITSYETLRREVNYVDLPHSNSEDGRRLRLPKRYMTTPSPLPCVEWWRVCLDEAQMVEGTTTKTAEMALRISAVNRWCITGTPIQKTVDDLQGLLMFLGVDPYFVPKWWQRCLYDPYCLGEKTFLHQVMAKYLWRNSKLDVINELGLPPQSEEIHWLHFTPVEDHFYKRLHSDCSSEALKRLNKFSDKTVKLSSLDKQSFSSLLQPLLKLRQACDHPQIVKGHFTSLNRKTLTMEELLDNLLKKTQVEAEDTHRIYVASLNGLAALDIIQEKFVEAVEKYRGVLQSVEEHKENFKTDSLQQLHTLRNLHEIIQAKHEGIPPTLRDGSLDEEANSIREKYLKLFPERIAEADLECTQNTKSIEEQCENYNFKSDWWLSALESLDKKFVREVKDELLAQYSRFDERRCILNHIENKPQLMQLLRAKLKTLQNQRKCMIKNVKELLKMNHDSLLITAIDCHLRPVDVDSNMCILCQKHELFEDYEENLFFMQDVKHSRSTEKSKETSDMHKDLQMMNISRKGNWGQSEVERVLKYLQTKSLGRVDPRVYEDSQTHMTVLQGMKKEFKNFRILWRAIYDHVSALDEVNMAALRMRIRFPGEKLPTTEKKKKKEVFDELKKKFDAPTYVIEQQEIPQHEMKFKSEKIVSQNELRVKLGQLFYLKNLKKADFGIGGSSNPEPCPICQVKLGHKWKVLLCGHSYCMDCVETLLRRRPVRGQLKCPVCRQPTKIRDIAYVDMRSTKDEEDIKVTGSLSTKMEGVVRALLKIKATDPEAKVLIFSSWNEILEVIANGFAQNGITYRILNAHKKFQENLSAFKRKQEITALLMLLSSGGKGLNLVEAKYVMLVEPILNHADEFQAIGRIHRIGQDKPTFVHRFLIHATIEERMFKTLHPKYVENAAKDNPMTIDDLYHLFTENEVAESLEQDSYEESLQQDLQEESLQDSHEESLQDSHQDSHEESGHS